MKLPVYLLSYVIDAPGSPQRSVCVAVRSASERDARENGFFKLAAKVDVNSVGTNVRLASVRIQNIKRSATVDRS
jgi:hypothetical protein